MNSEKLILLNMNEMKEVGINECLQQLVSTLAHLIMAVENLSSSLCAAEERINVLEQYINELEVESGRAPLTPKL